METPYSFKDTILDLFAFLRNPKDLNEFHKSAKAKLKFVFYLFLFGLLINLCISALISAFESFNVFDSGPHLLENYLEYSYLKLIFLTALFIPTVEELIFRLPLRYKTNYAFRFIFYIISIFSSINADRILELQKRSWTHIYKYFFYFLSFVFAFIHFFNFENYKSIIFFIPLLILPQFVSGLIIGFIRVKYGFIYGILYHSFHNFILFSIAFLAINSTISYSSKGDYYFIEIEGKRSKSRTNSSDLTYQKISPDTIIFTKMHLRPIISDICMVSEKLIINKSSLQLTNFNINSSFKISSSNTDSARTILLHHLKKACNISINKQKIITPSWELYIVDKKKQLNKSLPKVSQKIQFKYEKAGHYYYAFYRDQLIFSFDSACIHNLNKYEEYNFSIMKKQCNEIGIGIRKTDLGLNYLIIKDNSN